ncbi:MAG: glycogen synthase GlgA [Thermodesulfobacteriota bacterium]
MSVNVIFAASEAAPFAKTGGLADVAGSLPVELKRLGCKVVLFMPLYREVLEKGFRLYEVDLDIDVPLGEESHKARLFKGSLGEMPVYFIKRDEYYDRTYLYGTPEGDYFDNLERFCFFSRAVIESVKACGFKPDIIHCNDWQTGLVPAYLKDVYASDDYFSKVSTVLTIHNLAYQGLFHPSKFPHTGLSPAMFNPEGVEFWGRLNFLKAGIVFADAITTVSEAYSRDIRTEEHGWGLDGLLRKRSEDLCGILNGVDYSEWNPETDRLIPSKYSIKNMRGKSWCRRRLLREMKLPLGREVPLVGVVSRLAGQKGMDILSKAIPALAKLDLGLVMLGSGDRKYQTIMEELSARFSHRVAAHIGFDNRLAHLIEAGCDMFLMPSRYEPCGLNQIYSLKYGTIPIVRATGGLDDTVRDFREVARGRTKGPANGFKFDEYTPEALVAKVAEAVEVFGDKKAWRELQTEAMVEDFSWHSSALKYIDLYRRVIDRTEKRRAEESALRAAMAPRTAPSAAAPPPAATPAEGGAAPAAGGGEKRPSPVPGTIPPDAPKETGSDD